MGLLDGLNLPTLAETPKGGWRKDTPEPTRLAKKTADAKEDKRAWLAAKLTVWQRDEGLDRLTKRKVKKTLALDPLRGEVHHLEPRAFKPLRYDPRNLILLSLETHERVERNELRIVGTKFFTFEGKRYIDATYKVRFERVA